MYKLILRICFFLKLQLIFAQEFQPLIDSQELDVIIQKGLKFLENNQRSTTNDTSGSIYFKGKWPVRNTLFWISDAYTTAIVLNTFSTYNYLLKNQ